MENNQSFVFMKYRYVGVIGHVSRKESASLKLGRCAAETRVISKNRAIHGLGKIDSRIISPVSRLPGGQRLFLHDYENVFRIVLKNEIPWAYLANRVTRYEIEEFEVPAAPIRKR